MGGPVGLALATQWFGVRVRAVAAFAVKPDFNAEEVAGIRSVAAKGHRWFDTRAAAIERQIAVAGLRGLIAPDDPRAAIGIVEDAGKFASPWIRRRTSCSVRNYRNARCRAGGGVFFAGDRDPLVGVDAMHAVDPAAHVFRDSVTTYTSKTRSRSGIGPNPSLRRGSFSRKQICRANRLPDRAHRVEQSSTGCTSPIRSDVP